jgi:hypothetical protein
MKTNLKEYFAYSNEFFFEPTSNSISSHCKTDQLAQSFVLNKQELAISMKSPFQNISTMYLPANCFPKFSPLLPLNPPKGSQAISFD